MFGSGSAASGLMWWLEPGTMHHLDQTSTSRLQIWEREDEKKLLQVCLYYLAGKLVLMTGKGREWRD